MWGPSIECWYCFCPGLSSWNDSNALTRPLQIHHYDLLPTSLIAPLRFNPSSLFSLLLLPSPPSLSLSPVPLLLTASPLPRLPCHPPRPERQLQRCIPFDRQYPPRLLLHPPGFGWEGLRLTLLSVGAGDAGAEGEVGGGGGGHCAGLGGGGVEQVPGAQWIWGGRAEAGYVYRGG